MPQEVAEIRKFHSNKIKFAIEKKVFESGNEALREQLYETIRKRLGLTKGSKKLSMILNNTVQPTVKELVDIAQELGVKNLWELVKLEE